MPCDTDGDGVKFPDEFLRWWGGKRGEGLTNGVELSSPGADRGVGGSYREFVDSKRGTASSAGDARRTLESASGCAARSRRQLHALPRASRKATNARSTEDEPRRVLSRSIAAQPVRLISRTRVPGATHSALAKVVRDELKVALARSSHTSRSVKAERSREAGND